MTLSKAGIALLLGVAIAMAMPAPVLTQNCGQMLGGVLDKIGTLNNEARANNMNFLRDDVAETVGRAAKKRLEAAGEPTVETLNQIQEARDRVEAWAARVDTWKGFFDRLTACMKSGCNLTTFHKDEMQRMRVVESVREQLNEWIQSLGDAGMSAAVDRVNKASSLVSNVFTGAQGIAHSSITNAVQCMNGYVRDAKTTDANQVDPINSAPGVTPPSGGGGSSIGKLLGWGALVGGAAVGGVMLAGGTSGTDDYGTTPVGSPVTSTTPTATAPASTANYRYANWNCNNGSQCAAVLGANTGSVGPFCTADGCTAWLRSQSPSGTCTAQPQFTVRGFPPAGRACE